MLNMMVSFIIRMSNSANTLTQNTVPTFYGDCITHISENVERLKNLLTLLVFSNLVSLLDTSIWLIDENLATIGENQILDFIKPFNNILLSNSYDIYQVQTEWDRLKNHIR